jgi:hypothetical protein
MNALFLDTLTPVANRIASCDHQTRKPSILDRTIHNPRMTFLDTFRDAIYDGRPGSDLGAEW